MISNILIIKLKKVASKKAFTMIEVLMALVLSSLSLVVISKISFEMTKLSITNELTDISTVISSSTSEILLKMRKQNNAASNFCKSTYNNYTPVFLTYNSTTNLITTSVTAAADMNPVGPYFPAQITDKPSGLYFVQDNMLETEYKTKGFYRSIEVKYVQAYNMVNVRTSIYWNVYGKENYYVNYGAFSVNC
ncbi:MAG: prepilin-type N-terminal cleavage/methylation domain-containing protein [bacterium]